MYYINAHIEVKKDNQWMHYSNPLVMRDDVINAVICGINADFTPEEVWPYLRPVASGCTLPNDISEMTRICHTQDKDYLEKYYGQTLTHYGYMTKLDVRKMRRELKTIQNNTGYFTNKVHGEYPDLELDVFHNFINGNELDKHEGWDDMRIIFWFSNF